MTSYICKGEYDIFEIDGECVIINTTNFMVTTLNEVGGLCWSLLSKECTVEQLAEMIRNHFMLEGGAIEEDIELFLTDLLNCGLIQYAS